MEAFDREKSKSSPLENYDVVRRCFLWKGKYWNHTLFCMDICMSDLNVCYVYFAFSIESSTHEIVFNSHKIFHRSDNIFNNKNYSDYESKVDLELILCLRI